MTGLLCEVLTTRLYPNAEVEKLIAPNPEIASPAPLSVTMTSSPPVHNASLQIAAMNAASAFVLVPTTPANARAATRIPENVFFI